MTFSTGGRRIEEVQFVWQAALTDMAAYLDESPGDTPVAIGGWSPATMDRADHVR